MKHSSKTTELDTVMRAQRGTFLFVGGFSMVMNIMMLIPTLYMLQVYDRVMASRSESTLLYLTLIVCWMFFVQGILEVVRSRLMVRVGTRVDDFLHKRLYQAMQDFSLKNPGKTAPNLISELSTLRQFLVGQGSFAFFDAPWVPVYIAVLAAFHWSYGVFTTVAVGVLVVVAIVNNVASKRAQKVASEAQMKVSREVDAQTRNAEVAFSMGMLPMLRARWGSHYEAALMANASTADKLGMWTNVSKTLRLAFQSLILGLGAWLVVNDQISAGMVMAGSFMMGRALAPLDQMIAHWKSFQAAKTSYGRINEVLIEVPESEPRMSMPAPKGKVSIKRLIVTPPNTKTPTLKGIEFEVQRGEAVAVIGSSGAGKSSLIRAMLGIWAAASGEVRLDGTELQHWNRDELGPHLGYLPQEVELFDGTIAENIARFNDVQSEKVIEAAELAGVDEMIRNLPDSYETRIGVGGISLSGGQRQRIGLARAVYGDPKFIVLDEPNANLDIQGEAALQDACSKLKELGKTLFIVSHRPNILQVVDKLLVLENGTQKVFGPKDAVQKYLSNEHKREGQTRVIRKMPAAA